MQQNTENQGKKVAVSGSSGLVGRRLLPFLASKGFEVRRMVRGNADPERGDIPWSPATGKIGSQATKATEAMEGVRAVVHLAGENLAAGRWNPERRAAILESRASGTVLLCRALAELERKPEVLVCASAIGYYGDSGEEWVEERHPAGRGFLAEVCQAWEAATAPAADAGIRVVNLRIGMVIAKDGGALGKMLLPFRLGLGGPIGSGRQYMSWIALPDLLGIVLRAIEDPSLAGPINAVSPLPVTNREFARTLARVLRRPALAPLPSPLVRLLFGEMGRELLLQGQRVSPAVLLRAEYPFLHPGLEEAIRAELGMGRP